MLLQNASFTAFGGGFRLPILVGSEKSTLSGSATTVSVNKPTGVTDGDILLAIMVGGDGVGTWTGDTGFSETGLFDQGANPSLRAAIKTAASEGASYTFTSSTSLPLVAHIIALRFATLDISGSIVTRSGDGSLDITGITAAGGFAIAAVGSGKSATRTHSTPIGFSALQSKLNTDTLLSTFIKQVDAGATGTVSSTIGGGAGTTAGALIGIRNP